jgi:hypothetical protein
MIIIVGYHSNVMEGAKHVVAFSSMGAKGVCVGAGEAIGLISWQRALGCSWKTWTMASTDLRVSSRAAITRGLAMMKRQSKIREETEKDGDGGLKKKRNPS